jgi:hypothetical protein
MRVGTAGVLPVLADLSWGILGAESTDLSRLLLLSRVAKFDGPYDIAVCQRAPLG